MAREKYTSRIDHKKKKMLQIRNINSNARLMKRRSIKAKKVSSLNIVEDEYHLQAQPFVEEPVSFNFGDADYGNKIFADLHKELAWDNLNRLCFLWGSRDGIQHILQGLKYYDEDIYAFSSLHHDFL